MGDLHRSFSELSLPPSASASYHSRAVEISTNNMITAAGCQQAVSNEGLHTGIPRHISIQISKISFRAIRVLFYYTSETRNFGSISSRTRTRGYRRVLYPLVLYPLLEPRGSVHREIASEIASGIVLPAARGLPRHGNRAEILLSENSDNSNRAEATFAFLSLCAIAHSQSLS